MHQTSITNWYSYKEFEEDHLEMFQHVKELICTDPTSLEYELR